MFCVVILLFPLVHGFVTLPWKSVTARTGEDRLQYLNDGDTDTFYHSWTDVTLLGEPEWVIVELNSTARISLIRITNR